MSTEEGLSEDAADLLAQFPGPMILWPSKARTIATWLTATVAVILLGSWAWDAAARGNLITALLWGSCVAVLAYTGIIGAWAFITDLNYMTLDQDGFEIQFAWKNRRRSWQQVDGFEAVSFSRGRAVAFDDKMCAPGFSTSFFRFFTRHDAILAESYGFAADDFARLLIEWRRRALARSQ
jgi:hypothetical protein